MQTGVATAIKTEACEKAHRAFEFPTTKLEPPAWAGRQYHRLVYGSVGSLASYCTAEIFDVVANESQDLNFDHNPQPRSRELWHILLLN